MTGLTPKELRVYQFVLRSSEGQDAPSVAMELGIPLQEVANIINKLARTGLIEMKTDPNGALLYHAVTVQDRQSEGNLDEDEKLVYYTIKAAGDEGIWTRHIKMKTNLHQTVITRSLKSLESKQAIKAIKSVKWPTRKIYMLYNLTPSIEVSGGPWFTDQELDTDFVEQLTQAVYKFILSRSFPKKRPDAVFYSSHPSYPNAGQIHRFIVESKITNIDLSLAHINSLLDLLIFDGKIERKIQISDAEEYDLTDEDGQDEREIVYKALRDGQDGDNKSSNAWTDVPCGKCPVFDYCSEDGVVSPSTCAYYRKWLVDF